MTVSVEGAQSTAPFLDYSNHEINLHQDLKSFAAWTIFFAIITPVIQKFLFWPLARKAISDPKTSKLASSKSSLDGRRTNNSGDLLRNRLKKNGGDLESESSMQVDGALHQLEMKRWKFVVAATKLASYMFFFAFAAWALQGQWDWFWDPSKQHIPFERIPWRLKMLYFMEAAYYAYTSVSMFFEPRMKDRPQMMFHHLFTMTLIFTSYSWNALKYGTVIMFLHDFSDPWMETAKLFNYILMPLSANIFFMVFACSFFYLRVYIFPRYVIRATFVYARTNGYPHYWITFTALVGLWILHCIWSVMILRVFYENVVKGNSKGDIREVDE